MSAAITNSFSTVHERILRSATKSAVGDFHKLAFHAMGTVCRVHLRTPNTAVANTIQSELLHWVTQFEAKYSRFLPDSLIGRINAAAGMHWVEIDPETENLLKLCHEMFFMTRGVFDPTALPLIKLWNWKANPPIIPTPDQLSATRELCGWNKVQRRPGAIFLPRAGMCLDLGGIGKEYAVDCVAALIMNRGIKDVLVDFGQDVRVHGKPPEKPAWHIGLENPQNPGNCWGGVAAFNHAIATSGDYLRHFTRDGRRYGHIIDPRDGAPVNNGCMSVTVIAPNCTVAGIFSTTAFILGPEEGLKLIGSYMGADGCITTDKSRFETRRFHEYVTHQ